MTSTRGRAVAAAFVLACIACIQPPPTATRALTHFACRGAVDEIGAQVVCRERGRADAGATIMHADILEETYSNIVAVRCEGTERRLAECRTVLVDSRCTDDVGVAVVCGPDGGPS